MDYPKEVSLENWVRSPQGMAVSPQPLHCTNTQISEWRKGGGCPGIAQETQPFPARRLLEGNQEVKGSGWLGKSCLGCCPIPFLGPEVHPCGICCPELLHLGTTRDTVQCHHGPTLKYTMIVLGGTLLFNIPCVPTKPCPSTAEPEPHWCLWCY